MFKSCFCAILCCATVSLAAAQTSKAVPGLSLVPLWPQDGDPAPLEKDHYVIAGSHHYIRCCCVAGSILTFGRVAGAGLEVRYAIQTQKG
jgi:hypothetical protein